MLTREMERIRTGYAPFPVLRPSIQKRGVVHIGNAPDFRFPRLTPPRIRGILNFGEVTLL